MPKKKTAQKAKPTNNEINFKEDKTSSSQLLDLERIGALVIQLQSKLHLLHEAQQRALDLAGEVDELKMQAIPELMDQYNLSEVKLKDGSKVHVRPLIYASIPSEGAILKCRDGEARHEMRERLNRCFSYLRKVGAAALIKTLLKADFGKDSEPIANKAIAALRKLGIQADITKGVHPQSLNAWVRERIEAGKSVDMELFKVFSGQIAEITTPNTETKL
jgi:hypothetical protein